MNKILLDVLDAATMLSMSTRQVRALVRAGELPHVVFPNGEIRFDPADLSQCVESMKRPVADMGVANETPH